MTKTFVSTLLRNLGFIRLFDKVRFYITYARTYSLRRQFFKENPNIKLPPAYYIYETFNLNYYSFYNSSKDTAKWLVSFFERYTKLQDINILDWGCGPGRVIRHLPDLTDETCQFHGTDYNRRYIEWCNKNIEGVTFSSNKLTPPLSYEDNFFEIVYGISIFTHLSERMHWAWFDELVRVIKPGGILIITLQGLVFRAKLTDTEKREFDRGNLVNRSKTKEGHRTFSAFHPSSFVQELVKNHEVLEHV